MGNRIDQQPQGFAVIDPRWTADNLRANDGTSGNSSYTEADPEPGQMTLAATNNQGQLEVSGGQSRTVDAIAGYGGPSGLTGAGVVWRLDGETADTDYRGWNPPNFPTWWDALNSVELASAALTVIPTTQQPVINLVGSFYVYDYSAQDWSTYAAPGLTAGDLRALYCIPGTERLVLVGMVSTGSAGGYIRCDYSDDGGQTWSALSEHLTSADMTVPPTSIGADVDSRGRVLLVARGTDGVLYQFGSRDGGASWSYVDDASGYSTVTQVRAMPQGGFITSAIVGTTGGAAVLVVSDAFSPIGSATGGIPHPSLTSIPAEAFAAWSDNDGMLWSLAHSTEGIAAAYSTDDGVTWVDMSWGLADWQSTGDGLRNFKISACMGGAILLHRWTADTNTLRANAVWFLGGWSRAEAGALGAGLDPVSRVTFGEAGVSWTQTWLPIELPDDMTGGWAQVGATAGVINHRLVPVNGSSVDMEINTSAADGSYQAALGAPITASSTNVIAAQFQVISGGSLTSADVGFGSRWADGASDYRVRINATTTGFAVRDFHTATTLASVSVDMNTQSVAILMAHRGANVQVWYRVPGIGTQWVHVISSSAVTDGGALLATSNLYFGHLSSSTARSFWHGVYSVSSTSGAVPMYRDGIGGTFGDSVGRWLSAAPVAAPEIGPVDAAAFLALTRGPIGKGEAMSIEPSHRHPVEHVFPTLSASPEDEWRSVDDATDVRIALDFTRQTVMDGSWAYVMGLVNTNIRRAKLEGWDGAAWQTLGTYDGSVDFTGLTYQLTGDTLRPDATTSVAGRYLQSQELVGGYAILDPSGTPKVRKIGYQTAGTWSGSGTTTVKPFLRLEGIDGTELSSGSVTLVAPSGLLFVYLDALPASHYARFSLLVEAASNETAEGYFKIGAAPVGAVTVVGQRWGRGWSRAMLPNTISRTDAHGTTRKRQEGPPPRRWVMSWQTGLNVRQLRVSLDNNYFSGATGEVPLAADQDVWWQLYGLIESSKSGQVPVIACARFPDSSGETITDRTGWLYGTLTGTVQANNVVGDELKGEAMRVESITVEELV